MDITQTFYDNMASQYDKLFLDWQATTQEQAVILDRLFLANGFDKSATILDCACGIGTQAIGLAALGYPVTASDISGGELSEAKERAEKYHAAIHFAHADFRALSDTCSQQFDIVICMLLVVIAIIAGFTYCTSVAQDQPFKARFWEMALISISVAVVSFVVGILAKKFLGIDV